MENSFSSMADSLVTVVMTHDLPRTKNVAELLDAIEETYGAFEFFVKDLTQSV